MDKKPGIKLLLLLLLSIVIFDISGYVLLEKVKVLDALYMTIISISTVGFGETFPLSPAGKIFTIFVIISGLGTFLYSVGLIAEYSVEGKLRKILGRRKMKTLSNLKNHIIIAGFGRMGEAVAKEFYDKKSKFILIENNKERYSHGDELGYNILLMDATEEDSLITAGIEKAKTFISVLSSDADNVFTVMSAKELNPDLYIIARAETAANEKKLNKVGADRVIAPVSLASNRIINSALKPNVVNLIDLVTQSKNLALSLEEITITEKSPLNGKIIKESGLREKTGSIVVAVKRGEKMHFNPSALMKILPEDILILIGEKNKITDIY
ncbi:MAG: potassium channel protein [Acidobacteriota bacterium]